MNYLKTPNLPQKRIKAAIVDAKIGENVKKILKKNNIAIIYTLPIPFLEKTVSTHPDMQICHISDSNFYSYNICKEYYQKQFKRLEENNDCYFFNNREEDQEIQGELKYPLDCETNVAIGNGWAIGKKGNYLLEKLDTNKIYTNQGYSKCSVCIISDNAIITADKSISNAVEKFGIDVLEITNDTIELKGYKNGFIGGCCGKISPNEILFFGNLKTHPNANDIIKFCEKHNVECICAGNGNLHDYGSLLPIFE